MVQIVRYSNRKLYSRTHTSYLNLSEIIDIIRKGGNVQVTCNTTGTDLTASTLGQALVASGNVPVNTLTNLIRGSASELTAFDIVQLDTSDFAY